VLAIIGTPRGSPGAASDCPAGKAGWSALGPNGPDKSSDGSTASRVADLPIRDSGGPRAAPYCSVEQVVRSASGPDGPGRGSNGPTVFRGADLPSRDGGGCIFPEYEFIGIPYKS
jgi:hypothetical protein